MPLEGTEGAFLPCTFLLASVLALIGEVEEAEQILDKEMPHLVNLEFIGRN